MRGSEKHVRDVSHHDSLCVATKWVLKQSCKIAFSIGHMRTLLTVYQSRDHIAQCGQREINLSGFLQTLALCTSFRLPLRALPPSSMRFSIHIHVCVNDGVYKFKWTHGGTYVDSHSSHSECIASQHSRINTIAKKRERKKTRERSKKREIYIYIYIEREREPL